MLAALLALVLQSPTEVLGADVGLRVLRAGAEFVEEYVARDEQGAWRTIAFSPRHPSLPDASEPKTTAISTQRGALFDAPPSFGFDSMEPLAGGVVLSARRDGFKAKKTIRVPADGAAVSVTIEVDFVGDDPSVRSVLSTLAFAPDGRATDAPDTTFAPLALPGRRSVVGDIAFRTPVVVAQRGPLSVALAPNLDALTADRPLPAVLDLDASRSLSAACLLTYGFADYRPYAQGGFRHPSESERPAPRRLTLAYDVLLDGRAKPGHAPAEAARYLWELFGRPMLRRSLPQTMHFAEYPRNCYPAALAEMLGPDDPALFELEIDGKACSGLRAVGGPHRGLVLWGARENQLRSAWGFRWWAEHVRMPAWAERAERMLALALAAPRRDGLFPTAFDPATGEWMRGPSGDDVPSMATTGLWLLRWRRSFPDSPHVADLDAACRSLATALARAQLPDGSFPTYLRDSTAPDATRRGTAFATRFLAEFARDGDEPARAAAERGAAALRASTLPGDPDARTLQRPFASADAHARAAALLAVAELTEDDGPALAGLRALEALCLQQTVWRNPAIGSALTFGGFGAGNDDPGHLDFAGGDYAATLMAYGNRFARRDLFERGVAAARAATALLSLYTNEFNDVYPFASEARGLGAPSVGRTGTDHAEARIGFDAGEGAALATLADVTSRFGGAFVHSAGGWAVGVDGVACDDHGEDVTALLWRNDVPWTWAYTIEVRSSGAGEPREVRPTPALAFRRLKPELHDSALHVVGVPAFVVLGASGPPVIAGFAEAGERRAPLDATPEGVVATFSEGVGDARVRFEATIDGKPIESEPQRIWVDPVFDWSDPRLPGWRKMGDFPDVPSRSTRTAFGARPFVGTGEDGLGGVHDGYTGRLVSPEFLVTKRTLRLWVGGGSLENVYVELVRASTGERLFVERGEDDDAMTERAWDLSELRGELVQVRIVDLERGPWGRINVGRIVLE